jgi:hypothetical protein
VKALGAVGAAWEVLTFLCRDPYRKRLDRMPMSEVLALAERGALTVREMERLIRLQEKGARVARLSK